jgi:AraC family transcriptional regulator
LARARVLLEATSLPLTDIALELGFVSHSHFTSVFKQHHGTTPKAYRLSSDSSRGFGGALALREI